MRHKEDGRKLISLPDLRQAQIQFCQDAASMTSGVPTCHPASTRCGPCCMIRPASPACPWMTAAATRWWVGCSPPSR